MYNTINTSKIISYVVASDTGLAPNVTSGVCTLTVCKPVIRKISEPGDLIIGMSTAEDGRNKVIYAMLVQEKLPYDRYFEDPRFQSKKPDSDPRGDNFFTKTNGRLSLAFDNAAHFGKDEAIQRDLNAPVSVISSRFWYFGQNAPLLPPELQDTRISLPGNSRRGHRIIKNQAQILNFTEWLNRWPPGIHGAPRDMTPEERTL